MTSSSINSHKLTNKQIIHLYYIINIICADSKLTIINNIDQYPSIYKYIFVCSELIEEPGVSLKLILACTVDRKFSSPGQV